MFVEVGSKESSDEISCERTKEEESVRASTSVSCASRVTHAVQSPPKNGRVRTIDTQIAVPEFDCALCALCSIPLLFAPCVVPNTTACPERTRLNRGSVEPDER